MKVHGITEGSYSSAMIGIRSALGTITAQTICEALHCLALHPEFWSYPEQYKDIWELLKGCTDAGVNTFILEFDFSRNPFLRGLVSRFARLPRPPYIRGRITYMNECVDSAEANAEGKAAASGAELLAMPCCVLATTGGDG